jgi:hypothetical protein
MDIKLDMDKTDSKIRLFFELTYQKEVQITSYIPLKDYSVASWSPEKMYNHPSRQNYYVFINDPELIDLIKKGELEGQKHLFKLSDELEKPNDLVIEFNANSIEDDFKKTEEEQYIVFARITIDHFSFINDYNSASKEQLFEKNRPLIYANQGRIKEFLLGEVVNEKNEDANEANNSRHTSREDKKDGEEYDGEKEKTKNKDKINKDNSNYIPGHWFLLNMNNLNYLKKNVLDDKKKKIIKFLSVIKYKEIPANEQEVQDPNNPDTQNKTQANNQNQMYERKSQINIQTDMRYQQPHEFFFKSNDNNNNSKYITVYQPKSCRFHLKKNDFWCKNCNQFCCLECFTNENGNKHKNHKVHLLEEINNKIEEDSSALDQRINNLIKIIDNEILAKKGELKILKDKNKVNVGNIKRYYEEKNLFIKKEEIKRAKSLAALVNEILRIMNDYDRKVNYLRLLFDKGSMTQYLTNYYIFKKIFEVETKKNLTVLFRKVNDFSTYYKIKPV